MERRPAVKVKIVSGLDDKQLRFEMIKERGVVLVDRNICAECPFYRLVCYGFDEFGRALFMGVPVGGEKRWERVLPEDETRTNCGVKELIRRKASANQESAFFRALGEVREAKKKRLEAEESTVKALKEVKKKGGLLSYHKRRKREEWWSNSLLGRLVRRIRK